MKKINLCNHTYDTHIMPIEQNRGLGFEFQYNGDNFITTGIFNKNLPLYREAYLEISTFGVNHYYGTLKILVWNTDVLKPGRSVGGYLGGVYIPSECNSLSIELLRLVTEGEKIRDPQRWWGYEVGAKTNAFNSAEEIVTLMREIAPLMLSGKWVVKVESSKEEIIVDN